MGGGEHVSVGDECPPAVLLEAEGGYRRHPRPLAWVGRPRAYHPALGSSAEPATCVQVNLAIE